MPELPAAARFEVPDDVVFRDVGDETMILHLETATYFGLDEVGTRVWQLLAAGETLERAVDVLAGEFDAERARIAADVGTLVGELIDRELLRVVA